MVSAEIEKYGKQIEAYTREKYKMCFREPNGQLRYPFMVPGSCYADSLWDWDSWLTDLALGEFVPMEERLAYEKGCVLNFLEFIDEAGAVPIYVTPKETANDWVGRKVTNIHKPCLAQHALYITEKNKLDASWLKEGFTALERYIGYYEKNCKHESGLFVWYDDFAIGVDNDPCTYYRPNKSSASIYLNCLMYRELLAVESLAQKLGKTETAKAFEENAAVLYDAIQAHLWDERDGFFYSADVNLLPVEPGARLHGGCPRHWNTLIQRIGVWSGFLPMWAGIATKEQAERMVRGHYLDARTFFAPYGVRTLSKMEKMYCVVKSGNPSCWLGPIWGISNFMVFDGLRRYGFLQEAKELAEKTILMFGKDIEKNGEMHEYYDPETGEGVNNPGFQNWNLLSLNMLAWLRNGGL